MNISEIILSFLESSGMSQAELARKTGVPETTISRLKNQESCNLKNWVKLRTVIDPSIPFAAHPESADAR